MYYNRRMNTKTWKIAGINFDPMHMGDLLMAEVGIEGGSDK